MRIRLLIGGFGLAAALATPVSAAGLIAGTRGHLAVGYAQGVFPDAPGGSVSFGAGLEYPLRPDLSAGANVDYQLLGSGKITKGILEADVDYTLFSATAALHWMPERWRWLHHVTLMAGAYNAHAELNSAPGGSTFINVGRSDVAPGAGFGVTLMSSRPAALRVGFEAASHLVVLDGRDWGLLTFRFAVHY